MAVIYRSDIKNVDAFAKKALSNEVSETQSVMDSINSFVGESTSKLEGKAWNKERSRLEVYQKALEKRKEVSTLLATAIKDADRIMEEYIAAFPWVALNRIPNVNIPKDPNLDMVDSGWIAEFQKALNDAKTAYASAETNKNAISTKDKTGEDLTKAKNDRNTYQTEMNNANTIIDACNEVIKYLEQMSVKDGEAYAKYSTVEAAIAELNTLIEDVDDLFAAPTPLPPKIVYVPVGGSGSNTSVDDGTSGATDSTPEEDPTSSTVTPTGGQTTGQVTPIANTVTTNQVNPQQNNTVGSDTNDDYVEEEGFEDELIDEEEIDEGPIIGDDSIPETHDYPSSGTQTVVRGKNNTLKNVGLGLAGAAVAGAVGYGAYKAAKNAKENNEINEEAEEDTYNDYSDDFEIKTNEDDDA